MDMFVIVLSDGVCAGAAHGSSNVVVVVAGVMYSPKACTLHYWHIKCILYAATRVRTAGTVKLILNVTTEDMDKYNYFWVMLRLCMCFCP